MWMQHKKKNRQNRFITTVSHTEISINQYFIDTDLHNVDLRIICEALIEVKFD